MLFLQQIIIQIFLSNFSMSFVTSHIYLFILIIFVLHITFMNQIFKFKYKEWINNSRVCDIKMTRGEAGEASC